MESDCITGAIKKVDKSCEKDVKNAYKIKINVDFFFRIMYSINGADWFWGDGGLL